MQALAIHDLFRQLCGNPLSIMMMAAIHKVKTEKEPQFMRNISSHSKLSEWEMNNDTLQAVYRIVKDERGIIDDDARSMGAKSAMSRRPPHRNHMSLRISTEASLNLLQSTQRTAYELFYFIGCLKDGIKS